MKLFSYKKEEQVLSTHVMKSVDKSHLTSLNIRNVAPLAGKSYTQNITLWWYMHDFIGKQRQRSKSIIQNSSITQKGVFLSVTSQ